MKLGGLSYICNGEYGQWLRCDATLKLRSSLKMRRHFRKPSGTQGEDIYICTIDLLGIPIIRHSREGGNPVAVRGNLHIPLDSRLRGSDEKDSLT